ncbi:hypothetical protein JCM14076_24160 [Methylosoma difficile]
MLNVIFLLLFVSANCAQAQPALPPLNPQEFNAVIQEIEAMVKTKEDHADEFSVREATPERIERLYQMPELLQQQKIIRENGLIFAAHSPLLTFNQPSDVIDKMAAWFPKELADARTADARRSYDSIRQHIYLFGPYPSWPAEQTAFLMLWECMPENVWRHPQQNPFLLPPGQGSFMAIADTSSGQYEFSTCVHERSGLLSSWTQATVESYKQAALAMGNKAAPVLQRKFIDYLSEHRCQGTGPNDCVLLMKLWGSLSPADPDLAKMLQTLEQDVASSAPLPPVSPNIYPRHQPLLENVTRQAAFLMLKQASIANAPPAWSPQSLQDLLPQMGKLFQYDDDIGFYIGETPAEQSAMLAELERLYQQSDCSNVDRWIKFNLDPVYARFALKHLSDANPHCRIIPPWDWLKKGGSTAANDLRTEYLNLLGHQETGALHELLLANFTDDGKACFDKTTHPQPAWLASLCKTWISEPQNVPLNSTQAQPIRAVPLSVPPMNANQAHWYDAWLMQLVAGMDANTQQKMRAFSEELSRRQGLIGNAYGWQLPKLGVSVVELQLTINKPDETVAWPFEGWQTLPYQSSRLLLVFDGASFMVVGVPMRLSYESVVQITDSDADGHLEVWLVNDFRKCHGDDSDLQREWDCSAKTVEMGEIWGNALTYFSNSLKTQPRQTASNPPAWQALALPADQQPYTGREQPCNIRLLSNLLSSQLPINYGGNNDDRNDVIDMVCKQHPVHAEQAIVAWFYLLNEAANEAEDYKKGFAVAVINLQQNKIIRFYRDIIEEDAAMRIDAGSLKIDTARYKLADNVRAFAVRMDIGHSPSCAEGGESDYLTLFVEEKNTLKPVLKDYGMSSWQVVEGSNNCGYGEANYTTDTVTRVLSVADTTSHGWHDLEVIEYHQIDRITPTSDNDEVVKKYSSSLGKLRFDGKEYLPEMTGKAH